MNDAPDKILRTVERISFTIIGFAVAVYLISTAAHISPNGYGETLLEGLSVFFILGGIVLLLWVVYNVFNYGHTDREKNRQEERKRE